MNLSFIFFSFFSLFPFFVSASHHEKKKEVESLGDFFEELQTLQAITFPIIYLVNSVRLTQAGDGRSLCLNPQSERRSRFLSPQNIIDKQATQPNSTQIKKWTNKVFFLHD